MSGGEETFRYKRPSLAWDFFLGAGGLLVSALVIYVTDRATWSLVVFGTLAVLFCWFLFRTGEKLVGEITLAKQGVIRRGVGEQRIAWSELVEMKLRFFGSRREVRSRRGGVLQLSLKDHRGVKITTDSALSDFDRFAAACAERAIGTGLQLDSITLNCLMDLGIDPYRGAPGGGTA
jgi:hypothetical protein